MLLNSLLSCRLSGFLLTTVSKHEFVEVNMPVARNVNLSKSSNIMKTVVFLVALGIFKIEMCDKIFDSEVTFSVLN